MIAVDTNILVYAPTPIRSDATFHAAAAKAVRALAEAPQPWAIPWPCVHEFLAIATHPRIYRPPTPTSRALDQVSAWLESPSLVLLAEDDSYGDTLAVLLEHSQVQGPKVHDARIAALCVHHGISELWTADRDFSRFAQLTVHNPLLPAPP